MRDPRELPAEELTREELEERCNRFAKIIAHRWAVAQEGLEDVLRMAKAEGFSHAVDLMGGTGVPEPPNPYLDEEE